MKNTLKILKNYILKRFACCLLNIMQGGSWEPEFEQKKELDLCITTTQIEKKHKQETNNRSNT